MGVRPKSAGDYVHELNSRILQNPNQKMRIIQDFYCERVEVGDRETAELVLLIRSMMDSNGRSVPSWFQPAGLCTGILTLVFLMGIVLASIFGHEIPPTGRFPLLAVFALGCALSTSFLTGEAVASGKIPFFGNQHPIAISATGGIAVLIIILLIGSGIYQRLAVGETAVWQPGASTMFTKDAAGEVKQPAADALKTVLTVKQLEEADKHANVKVRADDAKIALILEKIAPAGNLNNAALAAALDKAAGVPPDGIPANIVSQLKTYKTADKLKDGLQVLYNTALNPLLRALYQ